MKFYTDKQVCRQLSFSIMIIIIIINNETDPFQCFDTELYSSVGRNFDFSLTTVQYM